MRRTVLYSRSPRPRAPQHAAASHPTGAPAAQSFANAGVIVPETGSSNPDRSSTGGSTKLDPATAADASPSRRPPLRARLRALLSDRRSAMLGAALLSALLALGLQALLRPGAPPPGQEDIDAAVRHSLEQLPPAPSRAATAYDVIRPSVVMVRRLRETPAGGAHGDAKSQRRPAAPGAARDPDAAGDAEDGAAAGDAGDTPAEPRGQGGGGARGKGTPGESTTPTLTGVGTGVVFSEDGLIFTNLHVVTGQDGIGVVFADGTESEVEIVDAQPENDLAVLKAKTLPDDLRPATLRSTRGLRTGDEVLAVGFPFGIGPTATWGVVSGLRRQHYSEQGRRNLVDLIQFDAAANPGNSGGPLVTRDGDVVGIVTSILNPTDEGFFVGIAFAVPIENAAAAAGISPF